MSEVEQVTPFLYKRAERRRAWRRSWIGYQLRVGQRGPLREIRRETWRKAKNVLARVGA